MEVVEDADFFRALQKNDDDVAQHYSTPVKELTFLPSQEDVSPINTTTDTIVSTTEPPEHNDEDSWHDLDENLPTDKPTEMLDEEDDVSNLLPS